MDDFRPIRNTPIPVRNTGPLRAMMAEWDERDAEAGSGPVLPRS